MTPISPLYDRNLNVVSTIVIHDRKRFNREVRRQYAILVSTKGLTIQGKQLADIAVLRVMRAYPELWQFDMITSLKNEKGLLRGYLSDQAAEVIAEVLA